jgi:hypothetical protein
MVVWSSIAHREAVDVPRLSELVTDAWRMQAAGGQDECRDWYNDR